MGLLYALQCRRRFNPRCRPFFQTSKLFPMVNPNENPSESNQKDDLIVAAFGQTDSAAPRCRNTSRTTRVLRSHEEARTWDDDLERHGARRTDSSPRWLPTRSQVFPKMTKPVRIAISHLNPSREPVNPPCGVASHAFCRSCVIKDCDIESPCKGSCPPTLHVDGPSSPPRSPSEPTRK